MPVHSHGDVSHDHPDAEAGHTHDTDVRDSDLRDSDVRDTDVHDTAAPVEPDVTEPVEPGPVTAGAWAGGTIARILLTVLGAAGMIIGAFLSWSSGVVGTEIEWRVFFATEVDQVGLLASAGFIVIILGGLALLGLVPATGWLTRLAGALGIIAFVLVLISLYRAQGDIADIEIGLWLVLAGGVVAVIGGFLGPRLVTTVEP
jgi:hypothetical protein